MEAQGYGHMRKGDKLSLAINTEQGILDAAGAAARLGMAIPPTVEALLARGEATIQPLLKKATAADLVDAKEVRFGPCLAAPEKIICIGLNYRGHAAEVKSPLPPYPMLFNKYNTALNGHGGVIELPRHEDDRYDYEAELVIVIGREAKRLGKANALDAVFGYCVGNDFSARGLQFRTNQFLVGKSCDGFAPIGPWLVPARLVSNPDNLDIGCWVNGEQRQGSNTNDLIFDCAELVSYCSSTITLKPGDIIFTGTPAGVIQGYPEDKRRWLKAGDKIVTRIAELGELEFSLK